MKRDIIVYRNYCDDFMKTANKIRSISAELDSLYGKEGTPERAAFREEAYVYCSGNPR
ncbi:hypothetical protein Barb7_02730 [Bacteroidales bacterium Barb7]|nr:hypothetical protein Barb7_02730 [Bacteroidales bacterium Barb7]